MIISTKIRYGLRALVEIALASDNLGVLQKEISKSQNISNKYLDHIIKDLKDAHLICNRKSKKSGYILCKKPNEITVYDVFLAFEKELLLVDCLDCKNDNCPKVADCPTQPVWKSLNTLMVDYMKNINIQDIIDRKITL